MRWDCASRNPRTRTILTKDQVNEIFNSKKIANLVRCGNLSTKCLAVQYGVTTRTIRDIWSGRTWSHVTEICKVPTRDFAVKVRCSYASLREYNCTCCIRPNKCSYHKSGD